jgi:hypothetical protein
LVLLCATLAGAASQSAMLLPQRKAHARHRRANPAISLA